MWLVFQANTKTKGNLQIVYFTLTRKNNLGLNRKNEQFEMLAVLQKYILNLCYVKLANWMWVISF